MEERIKDDKLNQPHLVVFVCDRAENVVEKEEKRWFSMLSKGFGLKNVKTQDSLTGSHLYLLKMTTRILVKYDYEKLYNKNGKVMGGFSFSHNVFVQDLR